MMVHFPKAFVVHESPRGVPFGFMISIFAPLAALAGTRGNWKTVTFNCDWPCLGPADNPTDELQMIAASPNAQAPSKRRRES